MTVSASAAKSIFTVPVELTRLPPENSSIYIFILPLSQSMPSVPEQDSLSISALPLLHFIFTIYPLTAQQCRSDDAVYRLRFEKGLSGSCISIL